MTLAIVIPDGFTREDLLKCVDREIRMREIAYPKWTELGKMTAGNARGEIGAMKAVRAVLAQLPETVPAQKRLF